MLEETGDRRTDKCDHACGPLGHGQTDHMTDAIKVFEDMHKAGK